MKYCPHNFLIPSELADRQSSAQSLQFGPVSPYCADCWLNPAVESFLTQLFFDRSEVWKALRLRILRPNKIGCGKTGIRKRRCNPRRREADLRLHLMEKQSEIDAGIAGKTGNHTRNYILRTLKNFLIDKQEKSSEGKIIRNTVKSLSPEGLVITSRKQAGQERAGYLFD